MQKDVLLNPMTGAPIHDPRGFERHVGDGGPEPGPISSDPAKVAEFMGQLDRMQAEKEGVDKVCIEHNHATGDVSFRTACAKMSPLEMMQFTAFQMLLDRTGLLERIAQLERRVKDLERGEGWSETMATPSA